MSKDEKKHFNSNTKMKTGKVLQKLNYDRSIQANVLTWNVRYKSYISGGRFDRHHLFSMWNPHKKDHLLKVLKLTRPVSIFLCVFALEAILKVDLEYFNRGNGGKTTRVGDSVGYNYPTMHFGNDTRWRTREDKQRFNFVYVNQRNDQRIPLLIENHSEKNLYQLNFDR